MRRPPWKSKGHRARAEFWDRYYNLAVNNAYLNRLDRAQDILERAGNRGLKIEEFLMLAYDIAFLKADSTAMEEVTARARAGTGPISWISNREAFLLAYSGRLRQAKSMSQRAVAEAQQTGQPEGLLYGKPEQPWRTRFLAKRLKQGRWLSPPLSFRMTPM